MARIARLALAALAVTLGVWTASNPTAAAAAPDPTVPGTLTLVEPDDRTTDTDTDVTTTAPPPESVPADSVPDDEPDEEVDAELPAVAPSVRSSDIPVGSIVLAVLVLSGVGLASLGIARRTVAGPHRQPPRRRPEPAPSARPLRVDPLQATQRAPVGDTSTLDFLLELGEALIDAGDAVSHVESTLRTVARVNGIADVGVLVLPTALIVSLPDGGDVMTEVTAAGRRQLRLDQIDDVLALVTEAEHGYIGPVEGKRRLAEIRAASPPHPTGLALFGYTCSTVGLAMILQATWREVIVAAALGAVIGVLRLSTRHLNPAYQPFVPLTAATIVSVSVFTTARVVDDLITFPLLVAPLITFLPGALLTIAVLELATGQIVAGASRLASGALQLVLLALGIVAGGELLGVPSGDLRGDGGGAISMVVPWIGVAVFGIGVAYFHGARRRAMYWILVVLYVAYAGQVIGGLFFGSALSAFFGAVAMTPVALLAARQPSGPAPLVTFLPGFWILVPGALGLEGVSRLLGDSGAAGTGALVTTVTSMVGISLGILLGLTLVADDPQRPWAQSLRRPTG